MKIQLYTGLLITVLFHSARGTFISAYNHEHEGLCTFAQYEAGDGSVTISKLFFLP